MLNEHKILFNNIIGLRKLLLNEAVGENLIRDAINDHKILYIYYSGDDAMQKGFRTIRPFVLGTHKESGNKVLRAWQDAGSSLSYRNQPTSSRWGHRYEKGHEYFDNPKRSGTQPGWRLFRVDKITSVMPTGEKFNPHEFFNVNGVKYRPDDAAINVDVAIQTDISADMRVMGTDSIENPDFTAAKLPSNLFQNQTPKFKQFFSAARKAREITKDEVEKLWDIVKQYRKKSPRNYWVIQNENGDMVLKTQRGLEIDNIPNQAIVGNLKDLYNKLVLPYKSINTNFHNNVKKKILKEL